MALVIAVAIAPAACSSDQQLSVALATPTPDAQSGRKATLSNIYRLAKRRDEAGLLALARRDAGAPAATPDPAIALGLVTIDRKRYVKQFVAAYPADSAEILNDYDVAFSHTHISRIGATYPVNVLTASVDSGDSAAYEKLLAALSQSIGPTTALYERAAYHAIAGRPPMETLDAFARLNPSTRLGAIAMIDWCVHPPARLLAIRPMPSATATGTLVRSTASATANGHPQATVAELSAVQTAISNSAKVDCAVARSSARGRARKKRLTSRGRKANHKTRASASQSH